jgi:hypothetical protein
VGARQPRGVRRCAEQRVAAFLRRKSATEPTRQVPRRRQGQDQARAEPEKDPRRCFTTRTCHCFRHGLQRLPTGKHLQELETKNNLDCLDSGNHRQMSQWCSLNPFRRLRAAASGRRASFWKLLFYGLGVTEVTLVHIVVLTNALA